jgi:hypothetical protein
MYLHIDFGGKNLWYSPVPWNRTSFHDPRVKNSIQFDDWAFYIDKRIPRFPDEIKAKMSCTLR